MNSPHLDAISAIKWSKLKTSGIRATALPDELRDVLLADEGRREGCLQDFEDWLVGEEPGKFFSASVEAVPLFIGMAADPQVVEGANLLRLAGEILTASHTRLDRGLDLSNAKLRSQYGKGTAQKIYQAAMDRVGDVLALAASDNPQLRGTAAFVLAFLYDARAQIAAALAVAIARETDDLVRGSQAMALGLLAGYGEQTALDSLRSLHAPERPPAVRATALLGLSVAGAIPTELAPDAISALFGFSRIEPHRYPYLDLRFPWGDGWVASIAAQRLKSASPELREPIARGLAEFLATQNETSADLFLLFASLLSLEGRVIMIRVAELTPLQHELLTKTANVDVKPAGRARYKLVPYAASVRKRWLGLLPPSPLEKHLRLELGDASEELRNLPKEGPLWWLLSHAIPPVWRLGDEGDLTAPHRLARLLAEQFSPTQIVELALSWNEAEYNNFSFPLLVLQPFLLPSLPETKALLLELLHAGEHYWIQKRASRWNTLTADLLGSVTVALVTHGVPVSELPEHIGELIKLDGLTPDDREQKLRAYAAANPLPKLP